MKDNLIKLCIEIANGNINSSKFKELLLKTGLEENNSIEALISKILLRLTQLSLGVEEGSSV